MPFSCSKFSLFFERVDTISEGATLDCSNGVFRHYDEKTHLCLIHKKRPLLCRVAAYYDALQSTKLSREEWYWLNEEAIRRLQEEGTTKMGQRPLPYDKKRFFVKFWGAKVSMHSWRGHALKIVRVLFRCVC